ncbi:hypothetical protein CRUP_013327 [Coryphaenoides rupestris]|nr:hypothetical protein CRUP_013327 [Coryphaenoides rupestris]
MAKLKTYIRGLVISLNLLLLLFGILMMVVGFSSGYGTKHLILIQLDEYSSTQGLLVLRGFGPVTMVMAILGLSAAATHTRPLLLVYCLVVFVVFVALMVVSAPLIQVQTEIERGMDDLFLNVTPLYSAAPQLQTPLKELQTSDSCCGLKTSSDWREQLPPSCFCSPADQAPPPYTHTSFSQLDNSTLLPPCVSNTQSPDPMTSHDLVTTPTPEELWVHSKPCGPILKGHLTFLVRVSIGVISAFTTVVMAAMLLSLALALEKYWTT